MLSLIPKITSIEPTTRKALDIITINGFNFGKTISSKSRVTINDKNVEIVSWSDKEIKIKLPYDIEDGSVVVYTGESYEYVSNKDTIFNVRYQLPNFYSEVVGFAPNWDGIDCKWRITDMIFYLCIDFRDGVIKGSGVCYNGSQEVLGTYDQ